MGIIGKVAMPFLSTLAALVIIVHSTEEDTESDYRRDLRPRVLDTGTPTYDQPWRVVNQERMIQKSTQGDSWNDNSPEEPPKRRRPGRKRKRRPQSSLSEDHVPQDRYGYPEEPRRPYFEVETPNVRQTTETVKKRRRKPEGRPIGWSEGPLELERPLRRRGQRRKRPSVDDWPELSEFNGYSNEETLKDSITETNTQGNNEDNNAQGNVNQNESVSLNTANGNDELIEEKPLLEESDFPLEPQDKEFEFFLNKPELQEDKSLSEFSIEVMTQAHESTVDEEPTRLQSKLGDKTSGVLNEHDKSKDKFAVRGYSHKCVSDFISPPKPYPDIEVNYESLKYNLMREKALEKAEQSSTIKIVFHRKPSLLNKCRDKIQTRSAENGPIDPISLKDILKRSNGSSLSEILQQHNLSLADLLRGKENAISILKSENTFEYRKKTTSDIFDERNKAEGINLNESHIHYREGLDNKDNIGIPLSDSIANRTIDLIPLNTNSEISSFIQNRTEVINNEEVEITTTEKQETTPPKITGRVRFPTGLRKKLRMRPMMNTTYKAQLSRDLIALNARKYIHHRRNNTKSRQWKTMLPTLTNNTGDQEDKKQVTDMDPENNVQGTTTENGDIYNTSTLSNNENNDVNLNAEVTTQTYTTTKVIIKEIFTNVTGQQPKAPFLRQPVEALRNRKQPFNRKKKRIRQKSSTTETPQESGVKNPFAINDYAPLDIVLRPHIPEITEEVFPTNLEDFMTTRPSALQINATKPGKNSTISTTTRLPTTRSTTEDMAKLEIDEILNDNGASVRLSKILMERNMTLSELVEHRERGSSHVHLADIFHNASKEPNPPEPFLSKSLIEPISKETYPLRAILEANLHDASIKATTVDPIMVESNYVNIPVIMDFGNNVNENAENMGIMSLFSNFTKFNVNANNKKDTTTYSTVPQQNPEGITEMTIQLNNTGTNQRESRVLSDIVNNDNQDDVASWKAIFSLMRENYKNESKDLLENFKEELFPSEGMKTVTLGDENIDGDGLIVLQDLQHLKDFDNNIASVSDEKLEFNSMERGEASSGILEIIPSQTKSVTVATASIAGLAIVLFLLTYAAFKWKQQRGKNGNKHNFNEERLPTPVFENRKTHKNNSSNRSISPMLSTSNIYTLNTLDSRNGKESPEYMWDTLRKPFQ